VGVLVADYRTEPGAVQLPASKPHIVDRERRLWRNHRGLEGLSTGNSFHHQSLRGLVLQSVASNLRVPSSLSAVAPLWPQPRVRGERSNLCIERCAAPLADLFWLVYRLVGDLAHNATDRGPSSRPRLGPQGRPDRRILPRAATTRQELSHRSRHPDMLREVYGVHGTIYTTADDILTVVVTDSL
jgi:hypothetical protein